MKRKAKTLVKLILRCLYLVPNLFIIRPIILAFILREVESANCSKQLIIISRLDFGTYPILLQYARCWEQLRGPTAIVILSANSQIILELAKFICPNIQHIVFNPKCISFFVNIFGRETIQRLTFNPIYCRVRAQWPNSLIIYDQPIDPSSVVFISNYIPHFDEFLTQRYNLSDRFVHAYTETRKVLDYHFKIYRDFIDLHYRLDKGIFFPLKRDFFSMMGIGSNYVVLNINAKLYDNSNQMIKTVKNFEVYDQLIDYIISRGFQVILQGRAEQPAFRERINFIDYSKSKYCSVENDLQLFKYCSFAIMTKTGPELLSAVCDVPVLGLNSVEHVSMQPNPRYRFYPKHLFDRINGRYLTWIEWLSNPCFFDIGMVRSSNNLEYEELSIREAIEAVDEFLNLLPLKKEEWMNYTFNQARFKELLTPLHLDLYEIRGVPCEAFLLESAEESGR